MFEGIMGIFIGWIFTGMLYGFYKNGFIGMLAESDVFLKYSFLGFYIFIEDVLKWFNFKKEKNDIEKRINIEKGVIGKDSAKEIEKIKGEFEMENIELEFLNKLIERKKEQERTIKEYNTERVNVQLIKCFDQYILIEIHKNAGVKFVTNYVDKESGVEGYNQTVKKWEAKIINELKEENKRLKEDVEYLRKVVKRYEG